MRLIAEARLALAAAAAVAATLPAWANDAVRKVPRPVAAAETPARAAGPATGERGDLSVVVDRAKIIRLPEKSTTVVVGNPAIADLAIQKNGIVVVTGKSYGVTNLIALDGQGALLAESTITVTAPSDAVLVVQRGLERQTYTCRPSCQPTVVLGDANTYFNEIRAQAEQRNQFATAR